jgi:hypothetical protein
MLKESDILHESGAYWVTHAKHGYEVFKTGVTHSTRCAIIGYEGKNGLERAIDECKRRAAQ